MPEPSATSAADRTVGLALSGGGFKAMRKYAPDLIAGRPAPVLPRPDYPLAGAGKKAGG